jgi:phospholipid/cholesterol/gamma-HCH transport system substrate-binding protein
VTETFANANDTLGAINRALETGERTLVAAESALTGADALINDEIATLVTGLNDSLEGLNAAIATVADDLPVVSADIRSASTAAAEAFAELQGLVDASSPGVQAIHDRGLADRRAAGTGNPLAHRQSRAVDAADRTQPDPVPAGSGRSRIQTVRSW